MWRLAANPAIGRRLDLLDRDITVAFQGQIVDEQPHMLCDET